MKREPIGSWADNPCWYASVTDAGRFALVLGPFRTEEKCREWAYRDPESGGDRSKNLALKRAGEVDPRSVFYGWGMVKIPNGYKTGVLNKSLPEAEADMSAEAVPIPDEALVAAGGGI